MKRLLLFIGLATTIASCSENYGHGERVGVITKFQRSGLLFKSWEGELHVTQTGMNSTMNEFKFSIDNNTESEKENTINQLDSAAKMGWKVRVIYHEVRGKNITGSRGDEDYFIDSVQVIDKNISTLFNNNNLNSDTVSIPKYQSKHDTIYLVIYKDKK